MRQRARDKRDQEEEKQRVRERKKEIEKEKVKDKERGGEKGSTPALNAKGPKCHILQLELIVIVVE